MSHDTERAPAGVPPSDRAGPSDGRLPLVLTVGFTGHRSVADAAAASRMIGAAFAAVQEALQRLAATPLAEAYDGAPRLRLLSGGAPGTDRLAQEAWRTATARRRARHLPVPEPGHRRRGDRQSGQGRPGHPGRPADRSSDPGRDSTRSGLGLEPDQAHAEVGPLAGAPCRPAGGLVGRRARSWPRRRQRHHPPRARARPAGDLAGAGRA